MSTSNFPKATFEQVVKSPLTWALILVGGLMSFTLQRAFGSDEKRIKDCNANTKIWQDAYFEQKRQFDNLVLKELLKERTNEAIVEAVDSSIRSRTEQQVKHFYNDKK